MIDGREIPEPTNFTPEDFGGEAVKCFDVTYQAEEVQSMQQQESQRYQTLQEAQLWFANGDREAGWQSLERKLGHMGWTDQERRLSMRLTGAEEDCGLAEPEAAPREISPDPLPLEASYNRTLDFVYNNSDDETRQLITQLSNIPEDTPGQVLGIESVLQKVEDKLTSNLSPEERKVWRFAQHALFLEKDTASFSPDNRHWSEVSLPMNQTEKPETMDPDRFGPESEKIYDEVYPRAAMDRLISEPKSEAEEAIDNARYQAIRAGRYWHRLGGVEREEGDVGRIRGWDELEGRLGEIGWTDTDRELSLKLGELEAKCGLIPDDAQQVSAAKALVFLSNRGSLEVKQMIDQFSSLPAGNERLQLTENLLTRVEASIGKAVKDNRSAEIRQQLRSAQQMFYLEKKFLQGRA